jgi:tetratricopeptide (TPR) repeat protein
VSAPVAAGTPIGRTGRGRLLRDHGHLDRVIDPRLCDERFRTELADLRGRRQPQCLPVVADGPAADGYRIRYEAPGEYRTLGEEFAAQAHWTGRLAVVALICETVAGWHHGQPATLALDPYSVLLTGSGDRRRVWLAPCPPVRLSSPLDLAAADDPALACIAPETVRGLASIERAEDMYALGTLAALALGAGFRRCDEAGDRVEAQARGALLPPDRATGGFEPYLAGLPPVRDLVTAVEVYRATDPTGRPADAYRLGRAAAAVADTLGLAQQLRATDPGAVLEMLTWESGADRIGRHTLAAEICAERGDHETALMHYEEALRPEDTRPGLRRRRCDLLWTVWRAEAEPAAHRTATLLADLAYLQGHDPRGGPELWLREAEVHERAGDDRKAAAALYRADRRNTADLRIALRYAACCRRLGDDERVVATRATASGRITNLVRMGDLTEEEGRRWRHRFDEV